MTSAIDAISSDSNNASLYDLAASLNLQQVNQQDNAMYTDANEFNEDNLNAMLMEIQTEAMQQNS